jgi:heme exporter protein A
MLFSDLVFTLQPGEMLLLAGPNGSGKSSLLRAMAGLLPLEAGELRWDDQPVTDGLSACLAYLGHADACKPTLSVQENLAFHADLGGDPALTSEALERVGLAKLTGRPGRQLSSGQRRRLSLARITVAKKPLWLLDEPTVGLDQDGRAVVAAMLKAHLAAGGLAVAATHQDLGVDAAHSLNPAEFRG